MKLIDDEKDPFFMFKSESGTMLTVAPCYTRDGIMIQMSRGFEMRQDGGFSSVKLDYLRAKEMAERFMQIVEWMELNWPKQSKEK